MSEKVGGTITRQVFGQSLESLADDVDVNQELSSKLKIEEEYNNNDVSTVEHFIPHPPDKLKGSSKLSKRAITASRFPRRSNRVVSCPNDSEDDTGHKILENRIKRSHLPPLNVDLSHDDDKTEPGFKESNAKLQSSLILEPLAPIKGVVKTSDVVEAEQHNLRWKQEKTENNGKPFETTSIKKLDTIDDNVHDKDVENVSESTLTSVSENSSSSDEENYNKSFTKGSVHIPTSSEHVTAKHHRSATSLKSQKRLTGYEEHHSDTEAIRHGLGRRNSLLPKVPASKARDRNSNFVQEELESYLPQRKLTVFVGTWNMHGEKQLPLFVDDFLLPECCQYMQDLYVIGSQESTPLRKEWEIKMQEALGPSHVLIHSSSFGVLHLAMFLRRELVWFCSVVEQATIATRPGHMIKTKGAIGFSMSIFGTSFLFINSHFSAHEQKWKERIGDYRLIRKSLSLPLNYLEEKKNKSTDVTSRFHRVFWLGDFNFRLEERHAVVLKYLNQCEEENELSYNELVAKDQMTKLMKKNGVFEHFKEAAINFPPTYRFEIDHDCPGNYSDVRVPSWTDRVVYRSQKENGVRPLHYDCCSSLIISDHRPVYGIFEADIEPVRERISFTGVHYIRDVYIEANRRRQAPPRNERQSAVCTIL